MATDPWRVTTDGLVLSARLTPRGGRDRIDGLFEVNGQAVLNARVAAPPGDGEANTALVRMIAVAAGIPEAHVEITSGATSRLD